jgi:hypothetical protein
MIAVRGAELSHRTGGQARCPEPVGFHLPAACRRLTPLVDITNRLIELQMEGAVG